MTLPHTPSPSSPELDALLTRIARGTADIIPRDELRVKLETSAKSGVPLRVKLGLDPTAPDIHLGFAVVLRKLRLFQDLGHTVVLIIGDYTALIGDPSGRAATRPMLTEDEINANARTYVQQLTQILSTERLEVRFNSEWLGRLSFAGLVGLASQITVAQVLQREDFANRFAQGLPISLHELLYPLAQGYDSVAIHADIEMGGQDQTFNILTGRDLQKSDGQPQQVALLMPLLVGLDGVKKMSKSLGNYVGIAEAPDTQFGKIMSIGDEVMPTYYELCTDVPLETVSALCDPAQTHPREAKKRLAREIVALYHGAEAADKADATFEAVHGKAKSADAVPDDVQEFAVPAELADPAGHVRLAALLPLVAPDLAASGGQAKRLITQGGVSVDGVKITDPAATLLVQSGQIVRVGKSHFARLLAPAAG